MNILEIIELRTPERDKILRMFDFQKHLQEFTANNSSEIAPYSLLLYKHKSINTDISIHLFYKDLNLEGKQSKPVFGLILKNMLKNWGLVNYSIWRQEYNFRRIEL